MLPFSRITGKSRELFNMHSGRQSIFEWINIECHPDRQQTLSSASASRCFKIVIPPVFRDSSTAHNELERVRH